jgi:hypothetical protein
MLTSSIAISRDPQKALVYAFGSGAAEEPTSKLSDGSGHLHWLELKCLGGIMTAAFNARSSDSQSFDTSKRSFTTAA